MYNMDDFINLCFNKNIRHFLKQDFESRELLIIVKKTLSDVNFEKKVNDYIKKNSLGDKKNIIFKNLRMTCVEGKLFEFMNNKEIYLKVSLRFKILLQ